MTCINAKRPRAVNQTNQDRDDGV